MGAEEDEDRSQAPPGFPPAGVEEDEDWNRVPPGIPQAAAARGVGVASARGMGEDLAWEGVGLDLDLACPGDVDLDLAWPGDVDLDMDRAGARGVDRAWTTGGLRTPSPRPRGSHSCSVAAVWEAALEVAAARGP